jgi:small subunit ribosomal protein S19
MGKRSSWKMPFVKSSIFQKIYQTNDKKFKTTSRKTTILPFFIGRNIQVHNGKFFIPINIVEEMVGYKLGDFVSTRLRHVYKKKNRKK